MDIKLHQIRSNCIYCCGLVLNNYDEVYMEDRQKTISREPLTVVGHYEPTVLEEHLSQFGIELTNDQLFTFNKSYIESLVGRSLIPGDVI